MLSQVKAKIERNFMPMQMRSSWFAWCIFKLCRWPFTQDCAPDKGCLIMHCRHSGFRTHFPPKTSSAHQNDCLLSGPCTTVESFRWIHVEILLRSDLTRIPLGVWLPQMIYADCSFQPLHMFLVRGRRLVLAVCASAAYVCVCELSRASPFSCNVLVYP